MPDFGLEEKARQDGFAVVAGVDEAGRGPWAGPVVAGAVILDDRTLPPALRQGLDDSKKLRPARREELFRILSDSVAVGIGRAEVAEIDGMNILEATMTAMARAVAALGPRPDLVLVDGNREPKMTCPVRCVVGGDATSLSIAAASIAAKVVRDRLMAALAEAYPGYGWERNAGYGTAEHKDAIRRLGVTPEHRRSFRPIRDALERKI